MHRPRILLADDHQIFLEGLKKLLERDFDIAGTVEDGHQLLDAVEGLSPDLLVVDISMPGMNGLSAVRHIRKNNSEVKILFLTMHNEPIYAMNAFEAGASGYVLKHAASEELIAAIKEVVRGRTYISSMIAGELVRAYQSDPKERAVTFEDLTPRQIEIIRLITAGLTKKEIATTLHMSVKTVEYHKYRIMQLLNIKTSAELVRYGVQNGLARP